MVSTAPFSTISLIPHNLLHRAYVAFTSQLLPPKSISIEDKSWLLGTWLVTALVLLFDVDNVIGLRISADEETTGHELFEQHQEACGLNARPRSRPLS
jgi:hypothetical protein